MATLSSQVEEIRLAVSGAEASITDVRQEITKHYEQLEVLEDGANSAIAEIRRELNTLQRNQVPGPRMASLATAVRELDVNCKELTGRMEVVEKGLEEAQTQLFESMAAHVNLQAMLGEMDSRIPLGRQQDEGPSRKGSALQTLLKVVEQKRPATGSDNAELHTVTVASREDPMHAFTEGVGVPRRGVQVKPTSASQPWLNPKEAVMIGTAGSTQFTQGPMQLETPRNQCLPMGRSLSARRGSSPSLGRCRVFQSQVAIGEGTSSPVKRLESPGLVASRHWPSRQSLTQRS